MELFSIRIQRTFQLVSTDMTIKISRDSGKNWQTAYRLSDIAAAYSDMVVLPNGDLGVMYETGVDSCYERIEFTILPAKLFK